WLNLELQWRNSAPNAAPDLLAQFSGCLTKTDFDSAQMSPSWASNVISSQGSCDSCHNNGTANFMPTMQDGYMFTTLSTDRTYMSTFFTIDLTQTPNKVIINQTPFRTAASGLTASGAHPDGWGDGMDNQGMLALQALYASAVGHLSS